MTGPAREALQALVDDQYEVMVDSLGERARHVRATR